MTLTKQQFIDIWTQLDALYGALAGVAPTAAFGHYEIDTPFSALASAVSSLTAAGGIFADYAEVIVANGEAGKVALAVNLAFVALGNEYVSYLNGTGGYVGEGEPMLEIAKPRGGPPAPGQSYHDNLLGNLSTAAVDGRFPGPYAGGPINLGGDIGVVDVDDEPRSAATIAFAGERSYFDGNAGHEAKLAATIAWDIGHGIDADVLDVSRNGALGASYYVVTPAGVATAYASLSLALAAASESTDTLVGPNYAGIVHRDADGNNSVDTGTAASEVFVATSGNETINGEGGEDTYTLVNNTTGGYVDLASGIAFGGTETGFDTLSGIENVEGGSGNDTLFGDGNDNTFFASAGTDTVDGRLGSDGFDASSSAGAVSINLASGTATVDGGTTTLTSIENAAGGQGADSIVGTTGNNVLSGNGGNDTIAGNGGSDDIDGGKGSDTVVFSGDVDDYSIAWDGNTATVTKLGSLPLEVTTVTDVGTLQFTDSSVFLVSKTSTEFSTIQSAVLVASDGDIIYMAAGTYAGIVDLHKDLTITSNNAAVAPENWLPGTEVVINRISTDASLTVTGVHVKATAPGAGWVNGGTWEAIGFVGGASDTLTVQNSVLSIDADGAPGADQGFGLNITYNTGDIRIEDTVIGPFVGGFDDPQVSNYGAWINGSTDTGRDIIITGNDFDLGTPRQTALVFDGQIGGSQIDVSGNSFGPVGTAPGAIRVFDFGDDLSGPQDYSGITGNTFSDAAGDRGLMTNETDYDDLGTGVTVNFGSATYSDATVFSSVIDASDAASGEVLAGGAGRDLINGSAFADTISGAASDDVIFGNGGADSIDAGAGFDTVYGGTSSADDANSTVDTATGYGAGATIAWNPSEGAWQVTDGLDVDTLHGIERVEIDGTTYLLVDQSANGGFSSIQDGIEAALAGDIVMVADGAAAYVGNVTLKDGVSLIGQSEAGVVIEGTMSTPASFSNAVVSNLTVENVGNTMLLDMTDTVAISDALFENVTFSLTSDFTGAVAIGNGQVSGTMILSDGGDSDTAGLVFRGVTMETNNHLAGTTAFAYTTFEGAKMVLDDVTLTGTAAPAGSESALGAQWNMTNATGPASVEIVDSHTAGGGNFYISGMQSVLVDGNTFNGQGLALNGVKQATVTGNTFQNIDGSISANGVDGSQHRGLVIEDAWGTTGIEDITVTGNTFEDISASDGAIAIQRFTGGAPADTATIDRLHNIHIEGNTFTNAPAEPILINDDYFGGGAVLPDSIEQSQLIIGTSGNDTVVDGSTGDMAIYTDAGDDSVTGGAGDDLIDGGEGGETIGVGDTAIYADDLSAGDISFDNGQWTVTTDTEGTDTLANIELVEDQGGGHFLLVGAGGYATIQAAINAADAGDTIMVAGGTYAENLVIDKALSLVASGDVTITASSGTAVFITAGVAGGDISFDGIDIVGTGAAQTGIQVAAGADVGTLALSDGSISGFDDRGIFSSNNGTPGSTLDGLSVSDFTFLGNGSGGGNTADIKLFGFDGSASFSNVDFTGATSGAATNVRPDSAIEITGSVFNGGNAHPVSPDAPDADITLTDVTVSGAYHKNPVAIYHFDQIDGLSIAGLDLSGAESTWGPLLNLDGIEDDQIDASAFDITFPAGLAIHTELQGEEDNQGTINTTITGTVTNDRLHGKGGDDTLWGGAGNDELYGGNKPGQPFEAGHGNDTLHGQAGDDLLVGGIGDDTLDGGADDDTLNGGAGSDDISGGDGDDIIVYVSGAEFGATESVDGGADTDTIQFNSTADGDELVLNADVTNVEVVELGGTADLDLDASAVAAGLTIDGNAGDNVIEGGSGNDSIDGGDGSDTISGGAGEDTITGGSGADTLNGGEGDDDIDGGAGRDVLVVDGAFEDFTYNIATGRLEYNGAGPDLGDDLIINVEVAYFADLHVRVVGNGGFATLQEAIDDIANSSDDGPHAVLVAPGAYVGNAVIADLPRLEGLQIIGVKSGVPDNGRTPSSGTDESTIEGQLLIQADGVSVDGLRFVEGGSSSFGQSAIAVAASGVTIANSLFFRSDLVDGDGYRGIVATTAASGTLTVTENAFSGWHTGLFSNPEATLVATGNSFDGNVVGLAFDGPTAASDISGNSFANNALENIGIGAMGNIDVGQVVGANSFSGTADEVAIYPYGPTGQVVGGTAHDDVFNGQINANDQSFSGGAGDDRITGGDGDDTLDGDAGDDLIDGGAGSDAIDGGADSDTIVYAASSEFGATESVAGGDGTDTIAFNGSGTDQLVLHDVSGVENLDLGGSDDIGVDASAATVTQGLAITGNTGANAIIGTLQADTIIGGSGADSITGSGGGDLIYGGTALGDDANTTVDTANYASGTLDWNGSAWTINGDTLNGIEKVVVGSQTYYLVDKTADGGFSTIQQAVTAAGTDDIVLVADGSYTEDLTVTDRAITIQGVNPGTVTLHGQISVSDVMEGDDTLTFRDFAIDATGKSYGITVRSSATDVAGVNAGKVVVDGMSIANARELGLFYAHPANGSTPTNPNTIGGFEITDSVFADNGQYHTGARGQGHVNLFGFNGDLTIQDSQFHGPAINGVDPVFGTTPASTTVNPHKAISVSGLKTGTTDVGGFVHSGDLVIDNVEIDGNYASDVVSLYNHESFASVSITDLDIDARGPWGLVNFDGVGGDIDLSTGINGTNSFPNGAIAVLQGLADANDLEATSGNDLLIGRSGTDDLTGGGGNDNVIGGGGSDTAHYENTTLTASMFTQVADGDLKTVGNQAGWSIATGGADGTDVVQGIEIVEGLDGDGAGPSSGRMLLVGNGGFATIADALAASVDGDTILIADGTYAGGFTISTEVALKAAGSNVVIEGPLLTQLGVTGHLNDFMEANHSNYSASTGATIGADNVTIQGLTFTGFGVAIEIGTSAGVDIVDNTLAENITGIRKGTAAVVTGIEISGNAFEYGVHGMNIYGSDAGEFDGVTMNDNVFEHMSEKGMYFEQLSNAVLSDNSFDDVGNYGRISPPFGGTDGEFGQAIDINLKSQNYANVVFNDTIITNSGNSLGNDTVPGLFGAAIGVKIRDDAPSYNGDPASFTGSIVFNGGSIDGTSTGIRVGEPGKNNQGPDVTVNGMLIENASVGDIDNATHPTSGGIVTVQMDDDQGTLDASHSQAPVHVTGTDGDETIIGGTGADQFDGGDGNDTYYAGDEDTIVEALGEGTDEVRSSETITLSANVENLTLLDVASNSETFEDFGVGAISDGENGWKFVGGPRDQAVVDVSGNHMLQISSDPSSGDFAGPYAPDLGASAGESTTTADADSIQVSFTFKAVDPNPGDNSSLEVDFATANRTDRNSFMRIENTGTGLRIAVATPLLDGNWTTGNTQNNFAAFTGNTELISGVDPSVAHSLTMVLTHVDGPDNDVIRIYLDGAFIGQSTSFENYRDALGGTHAANAEANQTGGLMFRTSAAGAPTDLAGGQNEGFLFDNVSYSVFESGAGPNGTGNGLANVITGNSGDNILTGLAGADTLDGGLGNDTLIGGADADALSGGLGDDTFVYDAGSEFAVGETISGGGDIDTVAFNSVANGDTLTLSAAVTGIEVATLGGSANLNLNVAAVGNGLEIAGNGGANTITGTHFADTIAAGAGNDIVNYTLGDGADEVDGGADTDRLAINGAAAASATLYAVTGGASLAVAAGAETIAASAVEQLALTLGHHGDTVSFTGNMTTAGLLPAAANTAVTGGTGNDLVDASGLTSATGLTLSLGQGNDTYKMGRGNDVIDGGAGARDLIDLSHIGSITVVNLATGTASGGDVGSDSVTGFEDIKGGSGQDFLTGNAADNIFYASAEDDVINGGGGNNTYDASVWNEATTTNLAAGYSSNSQGTSLLSNIQNVFGGAGDDFITGSSVANILKGGGGIDTITGGGGNDTIDGGDGNADKAVFSGNRSDYSIVYGATPGSVTVTHLVGSEGTDTITNVELLQFADGTIDVAPSPQVNFGSSVGAEVLLRGAGNGWYSYLTGGNLGTTEQLGKNDGRTVVAIGDLDGDGRDDVMFQTTSSGWYSYWSDANPLSVVQLGKNAGKAIMDVGDYNGDGRDDVLFQTTSSGWYSYWSGGDPLSVVQIGKNPGRNLVGSADFDGDGQDELLFVNPTSGWFSYFNAEDDVVEVQEIGKYAGRDLVALADFDGDGKDDMLFVNSSTGWYSYLSGASLASVGSLGSQTGATLVGIGDFDGDGRSDLLFQDDTSDLLTYINSRTGSTVTAGLAVGRTVVAIDDYDGDGRDDLLIQNDSSHYATIAPGADVGASINVGNLGDKEVLTATLGLLPNHTMDDIFIA